MLRTANTVRRGEDYGYFRSLGYDAVDYNGLSAAPGKELFALSDAEFEREILADRAAIEAAGLEICQIHGVWPYDDTKSEEKQLKLEGMIRSIWGAAILGSKYVVIHPVMPFGWEESPHHDKDVRENTEYMKMLVPYAEKYGVKIALENMPNIYVPCGRVEELVECIDEVNSPHLVACLDIGHSTALGYDAGDAVRLLGKRIHCLHVHDNDGRHDYHWLPYSGKTDWKRFTDALREIGYSGVMSLETNISGRMPSVPEKLREDGDRWLYRMAKHLAEEAAGK